MSNINIGGTTMPITENQNQREYWKVTNTSNRLINIGDLPKVPTIEPGETHDLLRYYSKDQVTQSIMLPAIIKRGWFTAIKELDDVDTAVSTTDPEEYFHIIEENELNAATDKIQEEIDDIQESLSTGIINISSDYYTGSTDNQIIIVDASDGDVEITLPPAIDTADKTYYIKKVDSSNNKVIVNPNETETIDGQSEMHITNQYECYKIVCTGAKWWII